MTQIVRLTPDRQTGLDLEPVKEWIYRFGPVVAQRMLTDTTFRIVEQITAFEIAVGQMRGRPVEAARALTDLAAEVGARELGTAAAAVADVWTREDPAARAATAHRLMRAGETALDRLLAATVGVD